MNNTASRRKYMVLGIYLMMCMNAICMSTQGTLLTDYINHYHLVSSSQGLMKSFETAGNIIALVLVGLLLGRLHKYWILMISACSVPVIYLVLGGQPVFGVLLALFLLYGIVFGFIDTLASSVMVDLFPENSARYMNYLHGVYGLGGLSGPFLLQALKNAGWSWNRLLTFCGILALIAGAVYCWAASMMLRGRQEERPSAAKKLHALDYVNYFKSKKKCLLEACAILYGAHQSCLTVWVVRYVSEYLHAPRWGAMTLAVFWGGMAVSRLLFSRMHIRRTALIFWGYIGTGLLTLLGILLGNGFIMVVCVALAGFSEGATLPMTLDLACSWEPENTSFGSTMLLYGHNLGIIVSPVLTAFLISHFGITCGMLVAVITALLAAVFARGLMKYDSKA